MIVISNTLLKEEPVGYHAWADRNNPGEICDWPLVPTKEVPIILVRGDEMQELHDSAHHAKSWAKDHIYNAEGWVNEATGWHVSIRSTVLKKRTV